MLKLRLKWLLMMHKIYKWLHTFHVEQIQRGALRRQWYAAEVEKVYSEIMSAK